MSSSKFCPCCENTGVNFDQAGKCSVCASNYRHRLAWLYMQKEVKPKKGMNMLYFSPDKFIVKKIKEWFPGTCKTTDYYRPKKTDYGINMEDIREIKDNKIDFILALNVLEFVKDDIKGMGELCRILKPRGLFLTVIDINEGRSVEVDKDMKIRKNSRGFRETTEEYDAEARPRYAKRKYGLDVKDKLENAGFRVSIFSYGLSENIADFLKYDLRSEDRVVCCSKP